MATVQTGSLIYATDWASDAAGMLTVVTGQPNTNTVTWQPLAVGGRRMRGRGPSIQAPMRDPANDRYAKRFACARCKITYDVPEGVRAQCPLCDAQAEVDQMRRALLEANNKLELQTNELNRLRPQVDLVAAMRQALELADSEDLTFLKSVAYRCRAGEPVSLKVMLVMPAGGPRQRRGRAMKPNGFVAVFRDHEETHRCTSMGGLALARYVGEGLASVGPISTMQHVMRAMSEYLSA